MASSSSPSFGAQVGSSSSSSVKTLAAHSTKYTVARMRDRLKRSKGDANNVAKPTPPTKPFSSTPIIVKRADNRTKNSVPQKAVTVRQSTSLLSTGTGLSIYSNGLWFEEEDAKPGKGYMGLYDRLDQEFFRDYGCLEGNLVGPNFLVPDESIKRIGRQLIQRSSSMPCVNVLGKAGKQHSIPYVGTDFREYRTNLTVGIAIQRIYMSILQRENAIRSITPFACGPANEWTLYIGDLVDSMNIHQLQDRNIGFVVSIHPKDFRSRGQDERLANAGIKHHSCQLDDSKGADMLSELGVLIKQINNHTNDKSIKRRSVLLHCVAGLSRSVNVALGWSQSQYYEQKLKKLPPGTIPPKTKFEMLEEYRNRTFEELKLKRPGVKCDNFKKQLERHAAILVGYDLPEPGLATTPAAAAAAAAPAKKKRDEEHGGGGYLKEAVVLFYYIYHLRPSSTVIKFGYERIAKAAAAASKSGGGGGSSNNHDTLQRHLKPWCDLCVARLSHTTTQKASI